MQLRINAVSSIEKKMEEIKNRLITFTQAAHILGYRNYRSILRLINEGYLQEYKIPHTKRRRLYLDEVMRIAVPISVSGVESQIEVAPEVETNREI